MSRTQILLPGQAATRGAYSPALKVTGQDGVWLFCTGQLALDAAGKVIAPHNAAEQSERIFATIGALLAAGGLDFSHVVRVQTYLTTMDDFPAFRAVRDRYLDAYKPASTLLGVAALAQPGCCVEVEVTAFAEVEP
jgi:enamine deaminase RidA (YjgF/YER057c/UK114 family)